MIDRPDLARMRLDYSEHGIDEADLCDDPLEQWERWLADATAAGLTEPNAMVVATVSDRRPRTRAVLAKGTSEGGIEFYTNYTSRKGQALGERGPVSATFVWYELQRQVTALGEAHRLRPEESDAYFAVRPRQAQLAAWASDQSSEIESRAALLARYDEVAARFPGDVPRPPHWGGYRIVPSEFEFWQGRTNRLHDRICYERSADGVWTRVRLAP